MTKLNGIDKVYIINLLGSMEREEHMRREMAKIGLDEFDDWEFIRPFNGLIDLSIDDLIEQKILDNSVVGTECGPDMLWYNNEWQMGTIALSVISYYLYLKSYVENKTILIFEDNIILRDDFIYRFNLFYDNLPNNEWKCLDLHSFNTVCYDGNVTNYYNKIKNTYSSLQNIEIKSCRGQRITNDERAVCNEYVLLGVNEGGGAKSYVIRPTSIHSLPKLPLIYPCDGIKNWLSGWWTNNISFVPREQLIRVNTFKSDRRLVNNKGLFMERKNEFIPLDEEYKLSILKYIVEHNANLN